MAGACLTDMKIEGVPKTCVEYTSPHSYLMDVYEESCAQNPHGTWVSRCEGAKYGCKWEVTDQGAEQTVTSWFMNGEDKSQIADACKVTDQEFVTR